MYIRNFYQHHYRHRLFVRLISFYFLVGISLSIHAGAAEIVSNVPSYATLLTDDLEKKIPKKTFSCTNPVYLYFTWFLLEGEHHINAFWINPQNKEENQIQLKFIGTKTKTQNWIALEFKNVFDQVDSLTSNFKAVELSGKWKVRILLDGNLLEILDFFVRCG